MGLKQQQGWGILNTKAGIYLNVADVFYCSGYLQRIKIAVATPQQPHLILQVLILERVQPERERRHIWSSVQYLDIKGCDSNVILRQNLYAEILSSTTFSFR